ncbi:MAG: transposase [Candidatus Omnitrophica bacterium]|nr:transposase [Candidatus Omnitrophota bacterium]
MKKVEFSSHQFYHIYNRGVDKRRIFEDENDYVRFIHSLFEFNDQYPALPFSQIYKREKKRDRELLVNIICFSMMPNHFHLILEQLNDGGITKFMRKLGTGYTMYFNEKYKRTGALFEGKFKAIHIENDKYLLHLSRYIHLNPVELIEAHWKEKGIEDFNKVKDFLEKYRWSSFLDYIGIENFPSIIKKDFLLNYFRDPAGYKIFVLEFLTKDLVFIKELLLED